jgi:iron-only hydrogenase group A
MLFNIEINDQEFSARRGETILTVLNRNGIKVPTLCYMAGMTPTGSCRMCMVEVDGLPGLVPACSQPVEEWMKIRTHSARVIRARRTLLELLLASHPDDCLYCEKSNHCELQALSEELNVRERRYQQKRKPVQIDKACPSVERNPAKCILCGRCIRTCDTVIGIAAIDITGRGSASSIGTSQNKGLNFQGCVKCGQCIMVCPTGALSERSSLHRVLDALNNPELCTVIQFSPTAPGSVAEEFGLKPGKDALNLLRTALRMAGFKYILDTSLAADLAIMEEATIIAERLKKKEKLPVFTASCPSWVHYLREFRPDYLQNLLPVRSPQQIMGSLIRSYVIPPHNRAPETVFSVSVMPCTASKAEAEQEGLISDKYRDVDAVLTIRELVRLIRLFGIDVTSLEPDPTDSMYGTRSSAGKLCGAAGGGLEGTLRTTYQLMTGQELQPVKINDLRGLKEFKEFRMKIGKDYFNAVAVSGLGRAIKLLEDIASGKSRYDIIEVMACPYGCINGGGQPFGADEKTLKARMKAIYDVDEEEMIKVAHKSPVVGHVYEKLLGSPGSPAAREMTHRTHTLSSGS